MCFKYVKFIKICKKVIPRIFSPEAAKSKAIGYIKWNRQK